jgi:Fusaric acid resistance protein-like
VSTRRLGDRAQLPALRGQVRRRTSRLRAGLWTIAQTSIAVGAAWLIAQQVNDSPFFAPISAVVSLAATRGQRTRRAIELVFGVAVGIAVADVIVSALGTSTPVLMLVVALSMGAALLLGGGTLLVSQAGVSAVFVATVERPHGLTPNRFVDALIGGTVALLVSQVLLPRDPVAAVTNTVHALSDRLGLALRETAAALRDGDLERARRALDVARSAGTNLEDFADAVDIARETISIRPPLWRARERLPLYAGAVAQLDLAVRNTRVLARRAVSMVRRHGPAPAGLAEAVECLAEALDQLVDHLDDPESETSSRRRALEGARRATAVLDEDHSLSTSALVAQVRSTAVDLLRGSGLTEDEAIAELEGIDAVGDRDAVD